MEADTWRSQNCPFPLITPKPALKWKSPQGSWSCRLDIGTSNLIWFSRRESQVWQDIYPIQLPATKTGGIQTYLTIHIWQEEKMWAFTYSCRTSRKQRLVHARQAMKTCTEALSWHLEYSSRDSRSPSILVLCWNCLRPSRHLTT